MKDLKELKVQHFLNYINNEEDNMESGKKKETLILNTKSQEKKYQVQNTASLKKSSEAKPKCTSEELITSSMTFTINIY